MYDFGKVKHPKTDITQPTSDESPVYDFFGYMSADKGNAYSSNEFENWYNKRKNPQSTGEGTVHTATGAHGGVDIQLSTGNDGRPLYAITDGKITDYRYSNSGGNMIRWKDANNFDHIYMHMQNLLPQLSAGQEIKGILYIFLKFHLFHPLILYVFYIFLFFVYIPLVVFLLLKHFVDEIFRTREFVNDEEQIAYVNC